METFSLFEQDPTLLFLYSSMHNQTRQCTPSSHQYDILDKIRSKLWSLENNSKFEYSCTISIPSTYFSLIKCKSNCSIFKMKRALYLWAERVIKRVEPCWPRFTCPLSNSWLLGLGSSVLWPYGLAHQYKLSWCPVDIQMVLHTVTTVYRSCQPVSVQWTTMNGTQP